MHAETAVCCLDELGGEDDADVDAAGDAARHHGAEAASAGVLARYPHWEPHWLGGLHHPRHGHRSLKLDTIIYQEFIVASDKDINTQTRR